MRFEFDPAKSAKNEQERGLPFAAASRLFEAPSLEWDDGRHDYGEVRISALGEIENRVFFVAFTRRQNIIRIISFRKANLRETKRYREYLRARRESSAD